MSGFTSLLGSFFSGGQKKTAPTVPTTHPIPGLVPPSKPPPPYPAAAQVSPEERVAMYSTILKPDHIDLPTLRDLASRGIPDKPFTLRATYWKILLHYLPLETAQWEQTLAESRKRYQAFREEFILQPSDLVEKPPDEDHPLSVSEDSQWKQFFKDNALIQEIDRDVKRTFPNYSFFNQIEADGSETETKHYRALRQLLFVYAKLNPGIRYVQGMNEIVAPIYYVFANDPTVTEAEAEADAFFCFTAIMSEVRDNFSKTADQSGFGVISQIKELNMLLKAKDFELWQDLDQKQLDPQFYTFRWITLLCSQEFELPDVLRLWDSLFSDPHRFAFLQYFCVAMIVCVRTELFRGEYADNLKLLQRYPPTDLKILLQKAQDLQNPHYLAPPPPLPVPKPPVDDSEYETY